MDIGGSGAEVVVVEYVTKRDESGSKEMLKELGDIKKIGGEATAVLKGMLSLDVLQAGANALREVLGVLKEIGEVVVRVVAQALKEAVIAAAEFEKVMTRIKVLSNSSAADMALYNDAIMAMAPAVGIGPQKLVEGLERITSLGTTGAAALDILQRSAQLSAVGMGEVSTIATALTGVINSYGAENLSAAQAADILTATVREGGAEANAYAGTLGRIAPLAAQLGISFADLGANLAAFTRLGVNASEASTGISGFMASLITPTKQGAEALASVGLSYAKLRAQIQDQGLAQTMLGLMNAFKGNDEALRAVLPNIRALRDAMATAGSQGEEYIAIQDRIRNSTGDAAKAFDETSKTASFQFAQMQAAVESAGLAIGQALLPSVQMVGTALGGELLPMLQSAVEWFKKNEGAIREGVGKALDELKNLIAGARVEFENLKKTLDELAGGSIVTWLKEQYQQWLMIDNVLAKIEGRKSVRDIMAEGAAQRNVDFEKSQAFKDQAAGFLNAPQAGLSLGASMSLEEAAAVKAASEALRQKRAAELAAADAASGHAAAMKEAAKEAKQFQAVLKDQAKLDEIMRKAREHMDADLRKDDKDDTKDARREMMQSIREEIGLRMQLGNTNGVLVAVTRADQMRAEAMTEVRDRMQDMKDAEVQRAAALEFINAKLKTATGAERVHLLAMKEQIDGSRELKGAWLDMGGVLEQVGSQMGGALGTGLSLIGAGIASWKNFGDALKDTGDKAQNTANKLHAAGVAVKVAADIWSQNKENLNAGQATASGAASGAQAGASFGVWGVVIGAIVGGLVGFFSGQGFRKMAQDAGKTLGFEVSQELAKSIKKTMGDLHVDVKTASLLNLDKAMIESGKPVTAFKKQVSELMVGIAAGSIPAKEGLEQLSKAFGAVTKEAEAGNKEAQRMMVQMMQAARQTGVKLPEIAAAVKKAMDFASQGLADFTSNFTLVTPEDAQAEALIFSSVFWAKVQEDGIVQAATALLPAWEGMQKALKESGLDPDLVASILGPMQGIFDVLGDEATKKMVAGLDGATRAVKGLSDAGYLTVGAFNGLGQVARSTLDQMIAGGVDSNTALMTLAPTLAQIQADSQRYGLTIDANTQALIDQAKAAGIAFPTDPLLQVVDLLGEIVVLMGGTLPDAVRASAAAFNQLGTAAGNAGQEANNAFSGFGNQGSGPADGGGGSSGYSIGGTVHAPESGAQVTVHGTEHILRPEQLDNMLTAAAAKAMRVTGGWQGGGQPIVVQLKLNEQVLAQAVIDMRRRGSAAFGR